MAGSWARGEGRSGTTVVRWGGLFLARFFVITSGEVFFEPDIEDDEEVAAAHFFDFELGEAGAAVVPGDGDGGEGVAADEGFEGEFDGDVEVGAEDGADAVDDFAAVGFEGVGGVVEAVAEEGADEEVGESVEEELEGWVVDDAAAFGEAGAEDAVDVGVLEFLPVADDIAWVIGLVGHHDDNGVAAEGIKARSDGAAEAVGSGVLKGTEGGDFFFLGLEDGPGGVGGSVVDDENLMGDGVEIQLEVEVLDGGGDAAFFVAGWDDDGEHFREKLKRRARGPGSVVGAKPSEAESRGEQCVSRRHSEHGVF